MKQPRVVLAAILMVLVGQSVADAQRARFVKAEDFDTGCLKSGQFVEVTYSTGEGKERRIKGYVRAIGDSSFTVSGPVDQVEVPFRGLDILIIGRRTPDIILIKHKPATQPENRVRSVPGVEQAPRVLA
jgi:hypothetical protein